MNKNQIFVDGIENVSVVSGLVRVDFFTFEVNSKLGEKEEPKREHCFRLLLSPESFIQTYASCGRLMDELKKRGLVVQRDELEATKPENQEHQGSVKSPNFDVSDT